MPVKGSKPGERRGGRRKGTPNKVTAVLKELFCLPPSKPVRMAKAKTAWSVFSVT